MGSPFFPLSTPMEMVFITLKWRKPSLFMYSVPASQRAISMLASRIMLSSLFLSFSFERAIPVSRTFINSLL